MRSFIVTRQPRCERLSEAIQPASTRGRRAPGASAFGTACSLAAVALLALACGCSGLEPPRLIVLITIDTLRADHLPMYGYPRDTSPFLAELAAEGVVFESAYSNIATTAPAHASSLRRCIQPSMASHATARCSTRWSRRSPNGLSARATPRWRWRARTGIF